MSIKNIDIYNNDDIDKYVNLLLKPIGKVINNFRKDDLMYDITLAKNRVIDHPERMNLKLLELFYNLYKTSVDSLNIIPIFHTNDIRTIINFYINKIIINNEAFFLVNLTDIENKYYSWIRLFPSIIPHYAIKSNPDLKIISLLNSLGTSFDCASMEEIKLALDIGIDSSKIIYANPVKSIEHILFAKEHGIDLMTFDSIEELYKIKKNYPEARIILRIKTNDIHSVSKLSFKFGMEKHEIPIAVNLCKKLDLKLVGVSFHVGSKSSDINAFLTALDDSLYVFDIAYNMNINLSILNIGGGFTYKTAKKFYKTINDKIDTLFIKNLKYKDITIISEPGRFFVETSHTLVLNIIGKKSALESSNNIVKYYLNDGIYGSLNNIERESAIIILNPVLDKTTNSSPSIFFGPTCDSYDTILNNILFPECDINEWLYINNMGAYTKAGSSEFNGFLKPITYYYNTSK